MMNIYQVRNLPTTVATIPTGSKGVHKSCLRAYQILEKTKVWLSRKLDHATILELISEMESGDGGPLA